MTKCAALKTKENIENTFFFKCMKMEDEDSSLLFQHSLISQVHCTTNFFKIQTYEKKHNDGDIPYTWPVQKWPDSCVETTAVTANTEHAWNMNALHSKFFFTASWSRNKNSVLPPRAAAAPYKRNHDFIFSMFLIFMDTADASTPLLMWTYNLTIS